MCKTTSPSLKSPFMKTDSREIRYSTLSSIQYRQSPKVSFRTSFVDSFFLVQNILSKSLQLIIILTFSD